VNLSLRHLIIFFVVWLQLSGIAFAKQVYLQDGGVIECESFWKRNGLVIVKINRDIILEFETSEINVPRTFHKPAKRSHQIKRKKHPGAELNGNAAAATGAPSTAGQPGQTKRTPPDAPTSAPSAKQAAASQPVAAQSAAPQPAANPSSQPAPGAPPATPTAPAAKEATPPEPAPETAAPAGALSKADIERLTRQNADLMAEALRKKDPALMKKAIEAQKNLQQRVSGGPAPGKMATPTMHDYTRFFIILLVISVLIVISMWVVFEKAGESGWKSLIPFYNMYVLMEISGKPGWWFIVLFVPLLGFVFYLLAMLSLAERFGRSALFGIGLIFLPMLFYPLLAFGASQYGGPAENLNFSFSEEPPPSAP